jgi:hypothetical protein
VTQFQTIPLDSLPKREPRGFDKAAAAALLAAVQAQPDSGATDGVEYAKSAEPAAPDAEARKVAAKHKRLLDHVAPAGKVARSRVFAVGKGFGWAVTLADKPADKAKGK